MKLSVLLDRARDHALPVIAGIGDDDLTRPTPCADYDVRALLDHLLHVVVEFQKLAAKQDADFGHTPAYPDWRVRFPAETARLVEAWAQPGATEGISGAMKMPARTVGGLALLDLTVHAWDLARATGQYFEPDAEVLAEVTDLVARMGPMAVEWKVFKDPVEVPGDASPFERLLAATGRDPRRPA
ncbi:TIGR03086 family protein [Lentzea xinjiangensis]|uniref:TIGR03086 family protein n=1 Tax=Lentzea xinjiangensis TaxID=402600 RepID=A0A1H9L2R0_9PSEU|nr:TIGR03086 family metal-binding protein [Lentzea xinjiangensis]SER05676.1 TIGR03086 family protein [Lentzea xinjiangensis]